MPDYEDMILARQEEREILEDYCDGECDGCPYYQSLPYTGWTIPEFFKETPKRCTLGEE